MAEVYSLFERAVTKYFWGQASLCGHYEVAQLLLESGSLCERDTFQGERYPESQS